MLRDEQDKLRDYLGPLFYLLPKELFLPILSHLYIEDLPAALQLNRYFADFANDAWKQKYLPVEPYHHSKGRSPKTELKRFIRDKCGGAKEVLSAPGREFFHGAITVKPKSPPVDFKNRFNLYLLGYENRVEDFKGYIEKLNLSKEELKWLHNHMMLAPFDFSFLSQAVRNQICLKYEELLNKDSAYSHAVYLVSAVNSPIDIFEEQEKKEIASRIISGMRWISYFFPHNSDQWVDYLIKHETNAPQAIFHAMMEFKPLGLRFVFYHDNATNVYHYPSADEKAGYQNAVKRLHDLGLSELTADLPRTFLRAAENGTVALLEALYKYHKDVDVIDPATNETPLIKACKSRKVKNALYLLSKNAKHCDASYLANIFIEAAKWGDLAAMEELYHLGCMPNLDATSQAVTALTAAVISKRAHVVEWLLREGADSQNGDVLSALNSAVNYPDINTFKLIVGDQVNVLMDGVPLWSWLAKKLALAKGALGVILLPSPKKVIKHYPLLIEWLVDHPAFDINFQSPEYGTGLHWLVANSGLLRESLPEKLLEKLFARKPDLLALNENNETLIDLAQQCTARGIKHAVIDKIMTESGHQQSLTVKLEAAIAVLRNYGTLLPGSKNEIITDLSKKLYGEIHAFQTKMKEVGEDAKLLEKEYAAFRTNIIAMLHDPEITQPLYAHRAEWKPIILNILIALTGIGLLIIAGKVAYSAITERREEHPTFTHLLFFGKTASQNKMTAIEEEVNHLSLLPRAVSPFVKGGLRGI